MNFSHTKNQYLKSFRNKNNFILKNSEFLPKDANPFKPLPLAILKKKFSYKSSK